MVKILIGVAWPYASGPIHLGQVAGCYLPADIFARYQRMAGNEVLMVSGSDQHGTPVTIEAEKEHLTPQDIASRYHERNMDSFDKLGISFDLYAETAHDFHKKVVREIFLDLRSKDYIYTQTDTYPYCKSCSRFLPDRYVEGICPSCGFDNARGDQCDECGKILDPEDLKDPRCKLCGTRPIPRDSEHFYLRLSAFEDRLKEYISDKDHWRHNVLNFTRNYLEGGLHDRAITRDLKWGVKIPLEGYDEKRIYVWFEAVCGYLSTSMRYFAQKDDPDGWKDWWQNKDSRHYYFLAKDNIPFHTIIWPAILMGRGDLELPYDVPANEYLTLDKAQFSKSRRHAIWLPTFLERYDPDLLRFYLTVNMPESRDADFTWQDFVNRINNELVSTLGNLIHRVLTFTQKNYGEVPPADDLAEDDSKILAACDFSHRKVGEHLSRCEFKAAFKQVMDLAHQGNRYFDRMEPWALVKVDRERCGTVLNTCIQMLRTINVLMAPFLPHSAEKLWNATGGEGDLFRSWDRACQQIQAGTPLEKPKVLYKKLDPEEVLKTESTTSADEPDDTTLNEKEDDNMELVPFKEFARLDIRVGTVTDVSPHPNADKLYVLQVDLGDQVRQIVAGLKPYYEPEGMKGRQIAVIVNLEPAKLRGVESNGMLLAGDDGAGKVKFLTPDGPLNNGARVR